MAPKEKKKQKSGGGISSLFSFAAFDMFGSPVAFNIRGDESYKTIIGCCWSLVMVGSLVIALAWYFLQYQDKANVEVSSKILVQEEFPKIDFKKLGF